MGLGWLMIQLKLCINIYGSDLHEGCLCQWLADTLFLHKILHNIIFSILLLCVLATKWIFPQPDKVSNPSNTASKLWICTSTKYISKYTYNMYCTILRHEVQVTTWVEGKCNGPPCSAMACSSVFSSDAGDKGERTQYAYVNLCKAKQHLYTNK